MVNIPTKTLRVLLTTVIILTVLIQYSLYSFADSLYSYPSYGFDDSSYGTFVWNTPQYITSSDSKYATSKIGDGYTHYLKATGFDFSSIPDSATINGIQVDIQRYKSGNGGDIKDAVVQLLKSNSTTGDNKADTVTAWPTSDTWKTYGGSSDLWGTTWSTSDIKNSGFGIVLSAKAGNSEYIDESSTSGTSSAQIYSVRHAGQDFNVDCDILTKIDLYVVKSGSPPDDLYIKIHRDSMTGTVLRTYSVSSSSIGTTPSWVTFDFDDIDVSSLSKLYLEVYTTGGDGATNYYRWYFSTSNPYSGGMFHYSTTGGSSWLDYTNYDAQFKSYGYDSSIANVNAMKITVYYTTTAANNPPSISNPYPANASSNVELQPTCHITVSDSDGDTMNISWYENTTGSWILQQTNSSVTNGTHYWTYTNASSTSTTYWWKVVVDDGTDSTTAIYHFTTKSNSPPSISNPYPSNGSTDVSLEPSCQITVSDVDNDNLDIYWYENTTGSWVLRQTNYRPFSDKYQFSTTTGNTNTFEEDVAILNSTHFVVVYKDPSNSYGKVRIGVINDQSISYGSEYTFNSAVTGYIDVDNIGESKFIIVYRDNGNSGYGTAIIGTVSGTSISFGSEYVYNSATSNFNSVSTLDSTHCVIVYSDAGDNEYGKAVIATITGTSISFGSTYTYNSDDTDNFGGVDTLDSTHFVVAYRDYTNHQGEAIVGSVSGTTITFGTLSVFNSDDHDYCSLSVLDSSHFVVAFDDNGQSSYGKAIVGSVSGTTISFGTESTFESSDSSHISVESLNQTKFVISYTTSENISVSKVGNVSGISISSYYYEHIFLNNKSYDTRMDNIDNKNYIIIFKDDSNSLYGTSILATINTTCSWIYTQANSYSTTYWWKVAVNDGTDNTTAIYHFTTKSLSVIDNVSFGGKATVEISNTPPSLTSPSVTPSSGVDSYTVFYFNITWSDADGDSPADGYLKVNISKTGWYTNVSMTYVSGSNTTGALYTYSTTLTAGSYTYQFWAYDGTDYNHTTQQSGPTVNSQSLSFTVVTSSGNGKLYYKNWTLSLTGVGATTQYNVSEDNDTASIPTMNITNTGNVPLNISLYWLSDPGTGVSMKYSTSFNPPPHGTNTIAVSPSETQIITNLGVGEYEHIWLWMDFENVQAQSETSTIRVNSSLYQ